MRYEDFVVHIGGRKGDAYTVRVLQSPAGEGVGRFEPPITPADLAALSQRIRSESSETREFSGFPLGSPASAEEGQKRSRDIVRRRSPRKGPSAQEVGQRLFDAVFAGQVARLYDRSLGQLIGQPDVGLRVKLRLDAEALGSEDLEGLPWELMYREETGRYLGLDRFSSIVRYLDVPHPPKPIPLPERLRVLVVMAQPKESGLAPLQLKAESQRLKELSEEHPDWDVEIEKRASVNSLRQRLSQEGPFHVVHFMGHGGFDPASGEGVLFFENADGTAQPISGQDLAAKLIDFEDLGLVFLNACETANAGGSHGRDPFAGVANALVRGGVPAVIAMQRPISDRAAIAFSDAFYTQLAGGACADEALVEGRQAIHSLQPTGVEWTIPVLFARIREGDLFGTLPPPQIERRPDRRNWLLGSALTILAILFLWASSGMLKPRGEALSIDRVFATSIDGVEGLLRTVELLPDGTMRLHFEFTNGSEQEQRLGLDLEQTYLADEQGNPYEVLKTSVPLDAPAVEQALEPGASKHLWIDVPAPLDGARSFGVALAKAGDSAVTIPYFEVELPEYSEHLSRRSEMPPVQEGLQMLQHASLLEASHSELHAEVAMVVVQPGQSMRWSLTLINKTSGSLDISFDPSRVVLVDNLGNVYQAQGFGLYRGQEFLDGVSMRRGLRAEPWFDFGSPQPGAVTFSFRLATKPGSQVSFQNVELSLDGLGSEEVEESSVENLPAAPVELVTTEEEFPTEEDLEAKSPDVEPDEEARPLVSFSLAQGEIEIPTTQSGFRAKLVGIDRLGNGRLRWHIELYNEGTTAAEVGYDPATTKLLVGGHTYRLAAADTGPPESIVARSLPSGEMWRLWLEFAGRFDGDESFDLLLGSPNSSLYRYRILTARLDEVTSTPAPTSL